ncbi:MAG: bifunctional phosphoribosylaminoimidazolecarboxamide formyltransferase/IMP cyclohydrolase [Planctomycetota bacterium]
MGDGASGRVTARRALLSVSDKSGLVELARALSERGCELISTGGTARTIAAAGLEVTPIERVTGFPEIMDGRVKTLHPKVHGGLLYRRDVPEHADQAAELGIRGIDLVCVNLYPFEQTIEREGVTHAEAVEQIDIGGPSMVRSAAKNHASVAVLTDPAQYASVIEELNAHDCGTTLRTREKLAAAAFARTAQYDAAIASYMAGAVLDEDEAALPDRLTLRFERAETLRYGENPHQRAAVYHGGPSTGPSVLRAEQIAGKALSYNNLNDAAAALELAIALGSGNRVGAVVVKHTNPCGASAVGGSVRQAVELALAGDPLAAYGGILAVSGRVDLEAAETLCAESSFLEVVLAPGFDGDAAKMLSERWKNLRLLALGELKPVSGAARSVRVLPGGALVQDADNAVPDPSSWTHAAGPAPDDELLTDASALVSVVRALSSNAVCLGGRPEGTGGVMLYGAGAGQMDRVASCRLAVEKAGERAKGAIVASDAFFPFDDGPRVLIEAGVRAIVHPGGSRRDGDTFSVCEQAGVTCLTTGVRHFRH